MKTCFILYIESTGGQSVPLKVDSVSGSSEAGLAFANTRALAYKLGTPEHAKGDTKMSRYVWRTPQGFIRQVLQEMPLLSMENFI